MKILGNVIKSQSDKRVYKAVELKNKLQCLIISDQDSFKSSAALSVGVGSLQDPMEAQGLAHYLQHMLFMGTKKYPDENQYMNYIAKNCGLTNAYTGQDLTNYHFEVASNAFQGSLDRFAQFFINPLMSDSSSERQLKAVHSEHVKNLQSDMWKKYQLSKHIVREGHPLKKFSTGNLESLSNPNLREMLHKFYNANYSANLMKLVVYSNKSPEELYQIVEEKFSEIPNKNYEKFQMKDIPYDGRNFERLYKMVPIKDRKTLELVWTLPDKSHHYKSHPGKYVSHLFGHEGKGSLLSFLITEGLAFGLTSSFGDSFNCYNQFQVSISLTKKGIQEYQKVVRYTMNYLQMLKNSTPQKWVYQQIKNVYEMKFRFQEKKQGMMFTSGLARNLQERKIEEILAYPYFMQQWKPEVITEYLKEMNQNNLMIFMEAQEVEKDCDLLQPIYSTKYGVQKLGDLSSMSCPVSLPQRNPFIPTDFKIETMGAQIYPKKLHESPLMTGFFKKDHKFELPKIKLAFQIFFEGVETAKTHLVREIYADMLNQKMREFTYLAESAQIGVDISFVNHFSATVAIVGFRDSVMKFSLEYLQKVMDFVPEDEKLFMQIKQKFTRALNNYFLGDPFRMAYGSLQTALREGETTPKAKLRQIESIKLEDILLFAKSWKNEIKIQSILSGNIEESQASQTFKRFDSFFGTHSKVLPKNKIGQVRTIKLTPNFIPIIYQELLSKQQNNSSVIVHFQNFIPLLSEQSSSEKLIQQNIRQGILQTLCYNYMKEPAFDYLRTKQQLGYIVMCLPENNRGVIGMSILIQSAIKTSSELIEYVNTFLNEIFAKKFEQLDEKVFEEYRNSLLISKQEVDKNLSEETNRFWAQIVKNQYIFDRKQREIEQIKRVSLAQLKSFMEFLFYTNPKRFQVHMASQKEKEKNLAKNVQRKEKEGVRIFQEIQEFRKRMQLYPDFYSKL